MPDPTHPESRAEDDAGGQRGPTVLLHLVQRLKSQPLLLALGVLLILAGVASASLEGLRALLPATIALFAVAVVAWLVVELMRLRRHESSAPGERVRVAARRVGERGEVLGIDDETGRPASGATAVNIKAEDVQGKVIGVRRGNRQP